MVTIEELSIYCKQKGFVYRSGDIYGGLSGFFDYGPLGTELKKRVIDNWWRRFVTSREDVVPIDGSVITNPKVWKASGHIDCFEDVLVEDSKTHERFRADHLVEDALRISCEGMGKQKLWKLITENKIKSPKGNDLLEPRQFNLMFETNVGPVSDNKAYLRPETAQSIFVNFRNVADSARLKLPFGIAQVGKAFRNEISPRDFLFRLREFEQMEIEYFTHGKCDLKYTDHEILFLSAENQPEGKNEKVRVSDLVKKKKLSKWHAYWLAESYDWYLSVGIKAKNLRVREHIEDELSHYSNATFDIDYKFDTGWKEIHGNADRGTFDLESHQKVAKTKMALFDEETKEKVLPKVIEPSFGVQRAFLAVLNDAYRDDKDRGNIVLKLNKEIAPVQVLVLPLVSNKTEIVKKACEIFESLRQDFSCMFDKAGSIGKRYARADEIGVPTCITVDHDTLNDNCVTLRDRDTTKQKRVEISKIRSYL